MIPSFLYPLFGLGLAALAAPLWLHLRRKEPKSLVRFSALQFLDDQPQARANPLRLQDLLLFALRILALLLLVAAFAWPYWPQDRPTSIRESRVYVLDNTLSRQRDDGASSDRDRVVAELREASADVQVAVVELTSVPRVVGDFRVDREELIARVAALTPSFERGSYLAAFRQAQSLLDQSLGERRRLVLLGDNQENQWDETQTVAPFLSRIEIELPAARADVAPNAAVLEPRARRLYLGNKSLVECEFQVYHQGGIAEAEIVAVTGGGEEVGRRKLKFTAQSPPTTSLVFQWEAGPSERVAGEVRIVAEGDRFEPDNRAHFSLPAVREGKVVALTRSAFLRTALAPEVMQGRWNALVVDDVRGAELEQLRGGETLVLESRFLLAPIGRELVDFYLSRGRGVLLLIDDVGPPVQTFLLSQGIEFKSVVDQPLDSALFRYVLTDHPIFIPFRSRDFGNLLDVRVHHYRRLSAPKSHALIYSQHGDVVLLEADRPQGKLLVSAFALDRSDSNWPLQPSFVPFLDLTLQYARAKPALQANFEPGERCVWSLIDGEQATELIVRAGDREWLRAPVTNGRVEFQAPSEPGIYEISFDGGATVAHQINVNPNPLESELIYPAAPPAVEAWQLPDQAAASTDSASTMELSKSEILRQNGWWWLLCAAALLLVAELAWLAAFPRGRTASSGA